MARLTTIIKGGCIATASDVFTADIGIRNGRIDCIGDLGTRADEVIDARGKLVLPGGIDSHCHMDQQAIDGVETADDFFTGTRSAACGGTTTVIPFAMPLPGQNLRDVTADYRKRAQKAVIDYGIHLIVIDPNDHFLGQELPNFVEEGYTSLKVYMTYEGFKLEDRQVLKVLAAARREGAFVMIHAENDDCIHWLTEELIAAGKTEPRYFAHAHAAPAEREATHRAITLAEVADMPVLIVHVSAAEAMEQIAWACAKGLAIHAETCPQYLFLDASLMDQPGIEAAKYICSPPPRGSGHHAALWRGLAQGPFDVFSSDHSSRVFNSRKGKMRHGKNAAFHQISAGIPGIEVRLPLLFSGGVGRGRITLERFVALAATNAAKLYGLYPRKGSIVIGGDADLAIWDPGLEVTISHDLLHDATDYTPYDGQKVTGWPVMTISRGELVCKNGEFVGAPGRGQFQKRERFQRAQTLRV